MHKFDILFTPKPEATVENPSAKNLIFTYKETIRFYGPDGTPCTGLDGDTTGHLSYPGFPDLPAASYTVGSITRKFIHSELNIFREMALVAPAQEANAFQLTLRA